MTPEQDGVGVIVGVLVGGGVVVGVYVGVGVGVLDAVGVFVGVGMVSDEETEQILSKVRVVE